MRLQIFAVAFAIVALTSCASGSRRGAGWAQGGPPGPRLFVSPAGEPFRPMIEGGQPLQAWFAQADADHDGALTFAEFRADFARAFTRFDLDGDGEIAPAEVLRYETETLPEITSRARPSGGRSAMRGRGMGGRGGMGRRGGRGGGMRRGGGIGGGGGAMMSGAARFGLLPISHPIMDADSDFNRGVSRVEFDLAAARRFNLLNTSGTGRLSLGDLAARRMPGGRR